MQYDIYLCVCQVSGTELNLQSVVSVVQQTLERLSRTKQEVNELQSQHQIQIQQQQEFCWKYRDRLLKVLTTLCPRKVTCLFRMKTLILQSN